MQAKFVCLSTCSIPANEPYGRPIKVQQTRPAVLWERPSWVSSSLCWQPLLRTGWFWQRNPSKHRGKGFAFGQCLLHSAPWLQFQSGDNQDQRGGEWGWNWNQVTAAIIIKGSRCQFRKNTDKLRHNWQGNFPFNSQWTPPFTSPLLGLHSFLKQLSNFPCCFAAGLELQQKGLVAQLD